MTREELKDNYGKYICELCCQEYFTNRAYPELLCKGKYCEEAEDSFADEHNIELEDLNIKKVEPIKGLSESTYNYLVSHCKRKIEQCKYSPSLLLSYNEHRIFLELLERVGRDFIEKEE